MIRALRMCVIALIGLATSAAVAAPTTGQQVRAHYGMFTPIDIRSTFPKDETDELRFPLEDPKEVDAVQYVNNYVNHVIAYVSDATHYGVDDLWVQNPVDLKGDCEDFAITKMSMLGDMAGVENSRIESVMVTWRDSHGRKQRDGHAILAYRFTHGTVVYLDINYPRLMTKAELIDEGYEFQNF
jgi:predicted transglutaminase-like cysteine proteinase